MLNIIKNKFAQLIFLLFSICILFYTFYKSEYVWGGIIRDEYLFYYLISIIFIIISLISFYINDYFIRLIILYLITIIFSLYLAEIIIRLNETSTQNTYNVTKVLNKFEYFLDYKEINPDVVIDIQPEIYYKFNKDIFPLSGISNSKTLLCNENGYFSFYESDRYGFNNPDIAWEGKKNFIIVGDSFAHGACVNRPNDIASVLRKISNTNVINLGYSGNDPLIEYASLREYAPKNSGNIIFLFFEGNDLINLDNKVLNPILKKYLENSNFSQNLKNKQHKVDNLAEKKLNEMIENRNKFIKNNIKRNKIIDFIKIYEVRELILTRISNLMNKDKKLTDYPKSFSLIMNKVKKFSEENNSDLYFVYLPSFSRYNNNNQYYYEKVKKDVINLNINFIDIHELLFMNTDNPLIFFPSEKNGHYNELGYQKITETIFKFIDN